MFWEVSEVGKKNFLSIFSRCVSFSWFFFFCCNRARPILQTINTARKVCDAMVAEHAKRAEYFQSSKVHKYPLKDIVWVERHHKAVLSRHRPQSWYIPGVILRKYGQDVYLI